jgi:hypothetical protein
MRSTNSKLRTLPQALVSCSESYRFWPLCTITPPGFWGIQPAYQGILETHLQRVLSIEVRTARPQMSFARVSVGERSLQTVERYALSRRVWSRYSRSVLFLYAVLSVLPYTMLSLLVRSGLSAGRMTCALQARGVRTPSCGCQLNG